MATIFFNFNLDSKVNLVDDLLSNFQCDKRLNKSTNPYFKKYCYPDIVLSEKPPLKTRENKYDTDYLGCYEYDSKLEKEGRIYLFYNSIYDVAEEYKNDVNRGQDCAPYDLKDNIENLATIVLIHEFVHWIMLWIINEKGHMQETTGSAINYLYFHEGFAQLLTYFIIKKNNREDLIQLFEWLAKKQSDEYKQYEELIKHFDSIEKAVSFLNILAELEYPIDYWEACVGPNDSLKKAIEDKKGDPSAMTLLSRLKNNHKNIYCKVADKSTDVAAGLGDYGF